MRVTVDTKEELKISQGNWGHYWSPIWTDRWFCNNHHTCSNQPHLVRATLNSKADKPVALVIKLEFGVLVFVEGGKPENPEKNS